MTQRAKAHLESMAPLPFFWIYRSEMTGPGVIHYCTEDGQSWTLLEDDEALFDECLQLLLDSNCIIFNDAQAMMSHVERLQSYN